MSSNKPNDPANTPRLLINNVIEFPRRCASPPPAEIRQSPASLLKLWDRAGQQEALARVPEQLLHTTAVWWSVPDDAVSATGVTRRRAQGAAHAAEHASIGLLPLFETSFGLTTDITLIQLSDLNHPLLRDYLEPEAFARLLSGKGIGPEHTVVFYGDKNNWWACYAFWVFQLFGQPVGDQCRFA